MFYKKASLVISIYKNVEALKAVLDSLKFQSVKPYEIVISEDGEDKIVKDFLNNYEYDGQMQHLTQTDDGWGKNKALNRAIKSAKTDYLIFIDGDCVLHPRFVESHLNFAKPQVVLGGKRIKLDQYSSEKLLKGELNPDQMNKYVISSYSEIKKAQSKFIEEGIFIDPKGWFGFIPKIRSMHQLKGCNMSFSKQAAFAINGFDEDYIKPAIGEDIDLTWRFKRAGYQLKSLRNLAVQYHLYHKENWTDQSENIKIMEGRKALNQYVCINGLEKNRR